MSSSNINDLSASNNPKELMAKKNKLIPVLKRGVITEEPDDIEKVRYEFVSPNQFFGNTLNLLPMQNSVTAARAFYEHKFITQALPIKDGESPNVQSLKNADNNESYEDYLGKKTGVISLDEDDNSADILEVTPDYIKYKNDKGETKTKNLYNNFAFNRKTMLTNYPLVKAGDKISRDKSKNPPILAKTNFTDNNGTLNMGLNARVGFVPYKGWSMDDAVVISEDFAKKMTSQHMYQYSEANDSKDIKTGKDHFKAFYPDKFNKEQMDKIDDNGVIKAGTVVNPGDPLIVSTRSRVVSSNDANLGRLSKYLKTTRLDSSQVWDHNTPGIVTDVVKTNDGYKVNVETFAPMQEGDKMCYHPDTEVFTEDGWKNITEVTFKDKVAALFDRNQDKFVHKNGKFCKDKQDLYAKFVYPYHLMHYTYSGDLYEVDAPRVAYSVTPTHRIWCKSRNNKSNDNKWEAKDAHTIYGMSKMFMVSADFDLSDRELPETIKIPYYEYEDSKTLNKLTDKDNLCEFNTLDFAMFMAFYLSEGSTQHKHQKNFNIAITQTKKPLCAVIEKILNRLGFNYYYNDLTSQYIIIHQKSLAIYLKQFGTASEKFIPDWIKKLPKEGLELFIASYFNGDGDKKRAKTIWTSSYKMVQDLAYIYTLLGGSPSIHVRERFNYSNLNAKGKIIKANFPSYEIRFLEFRIAALHNNRENNCHLKRKYDGEVYCVSVHGLGIILTRFKGKQSWQGNSSRSGNKLTVSHILPQNEMPRTKDGKPLDVLFNQLGLVSRVNANMMYEAMLGKVAEKTGKKYKLPTFNKDSEKWYDFVENELKKNNLSDVEPVYDPVIDRDLDQPIAVGNAYFLKLHHTSDSKLSSRGQGIYDQNEMPVKGGEEGMMAKRHSNLESNAILSSGAYNVIKDAIHLRGQRNDDYWRKVRMGQTPSLAKKSPFIWDKYIALMQGAGINAKRADNGDSIQATPFTDKDFALFNPVEIKNDGIIDFKNMKPISGGLFDPALTVGNRWGKITLDRPYPNPAFEDTIISLLGLKRSTFNDILAGKESLLKYGTGTQAIYNALSDIDIDKDLEQAKQDFKYGPKSKKQQALNRIMALDGLKNNRMKPEEFMITKVPVIPPKFRPYSVMGKDTFLPGDANELYQDVINMAHTQGEILQELGPDEASKNVPNVYKSLKALYGYGEPASRKLKQRGVSGFLQKLIGGTSKFSQWNRNVISKPVDFSARGVIDANPEISMDELGIPYEMGFEIYSPYIQRELVKRGLSPKDALQNIKDHTKMAKDALQAVVDGGRWITASRAPAWFKMGVLGFKPVFHEGKNILLPPVVSSGLGADFDGDCQWGHVFVCLRDS
jgi:hypothetical protein